MKSSSVTVQKWPTVQYCFGSAIFSCCVIIQMKPLLKYFLMTWYYLVFNVLKGDLIRFPCIVKSKIMKRKKNMQREHYPIILCLSVHSCKDLYFVFTTYGNNFYRIFVQFSARNNFHVRQIENLQEKLEFIKWACDFYNQKTTETWSQEVVSEQ